MSLLNHIRNIPKGIKIPILGSTHNVINLGRNIIIVIERVKILKGFCVFEVKHLIENKPEKLPLIL